MRFCALKGAKTNLTRGKLPYDRNDLSYDFSVVVLPKLYGAMTLLWIGMNNQVIVLYAATSTKILSLSPDQNVERLFPKWHRSKMERLFLSTVHDGHQSAYQIGVKRIAFSTDPKEIF